jgi:hypothetical protein
MIHPPFVICQLQVQNGDFTTTAKTVISHVEDVASAMESLLFYK